VPSGPRAAPVATLHPEWDRLIARLRSAWCRVIESAVPDGPALAIADTTLAAARQLAGPVRDIARRAARPGCSDSGESFDLEALVQWQLGRRLRRPAQVRVYQTRRDVAARTALWLLIDQSASTGAGAAAADGGALRVAAQAALALGLALRARGIVFGVAAFNSNGRHAVHWRTAKSFAQSPDTAMASRLQTLRAEGSTRLGAALRHATQRLTMQRGSQRWVVLLSDGSPYDIDVHDPAYLLEDARRAVQAAARRGVRTGCLVCEPGAGAEAARIFGSNAAVRVHGLKDLPGALRRLLA
jgi:nitric oxide reductase NorD protein